MGYYVTLTELQGGVTKDEGLIPVDFNSSYRLNNGLNLKDMRDNAIENLKGLLGALGYGKAEVSDPAAAMADLNKRIEEFHQTTASFNGQRLRVEIMNPLKGIVVNEAQVEMTRFKSLIQNKQNEIAYIFNQVVEATLNGMVPDEAGEVAIDSVAAEIFALMGQITIDLSSGAVTVSGKGGKSKDLKNELKPAILKSIKRSIMSIQFSGDVGPDIKYLINKDVNFSKRLIMLAQQMGINVESFFPQGINKAPSFDISETSDGLNIYYDILTPFLNEMEASDAKGTKAEKAALAYFEGLQEPKKTEMKNKLVERAQGFMGQFFDTNNLAPARAEELKKRFNQAIGDIVYNYPASLFVGSNEQGIIGILGEIQGLYYVYSILGDKNPSVDPATLVKWIGGDTGAGGGVKTGADLIVEIADKLGYGIQVKNSMDLTGATSFSDFAIGKGQEGEFYKQLVTFGIDPQIVEAIDDVFTMQSFNIAYHYEGPVPVKGKPIGPNAAQYLSTYEKVQELVQRAQKFMALAAAMMMRIQYLQGEGYTQTNTLWIVGGTAMISAAQILNDLIDQIDGINSNNFKMSASAYFGDKGVTIVDYLQNKVDISKTRSVLKTSYNFHKTGSRV